MPCDRSRGNRFPAMNSSSAINRWRPQWHGRDRRLIVLGDLNDTPQAATTQLLYGPPGSQFDTGGFNHPDQGDAWRLWNLAPRIPVEHRFSRIFEGQPELIDHILISHALLADLVSVDADVTGLAS